ncbi:unnamed protein product, partial [Symbiodinium sp. KB8]
PGKAFPLERIELKGKGRFGKRIVLGQCMNYSQVVAMLQSRLDYLEGIAMLQSKMDYLEGLAMQQSKMDYLEGVGLQSRLDYLEGLAMQQSKMDYLEGVGLQSKMDYLEGVGLQSKVTYLEGVGLQSKVIYLEGIRLQGEMGYLGGIAMQQSKMDYLGGIAMQQSKMDYQGVAMLQSKMDYQAVAMLQSKMDYQGVAMLQSKMDYQGVAMLQSKMDYQVQTKALERRSTVDPEAVKPGVNALPELKPPTPETAPVEVQDWLQLLAAPMSDLSDSSGSGEWWMKIQELAQQGYQEWSEATSLERLSLRPPRRKELEEGKYARLNSRASSMLVASLDPQVRADLVTRRCTSSASQILFRVLTLYQPGGEAEKRLVIEQLQNGTSQPDAPKAAEALRNWERWHRRAADVGVATPDPTILSRALTGIRKKVLDANPEAAFRTSLLRNSLKLDTRPTDETIHAYHKHLLAEAEVLTTGAPRSANTSTATTEATRISSGDKPTKLKGLQATGEAEQAPKAKDAKGAPIANFFMIGKVFQRVDGSRFETEATGAINCYLDDTSCQQGLECESGTTQAEQPQQDELKQVIADASKMIKSMMAQSSASSAATPTSGAPTYESIQKQLDELKLRAMKVGAKVEESVEERGVLLDSGSTHILRPPANDGELEASKPVAVTLASDEHKVMHQCPAGSLIVQSEQGAPSPQSIIPFGKVIEIIAELEMKRVDELKQRTEQLQDQLDAVRMLEVKDADWRILMARYAEVLNGPGDRPQRQGRMGVLEDAPRTQKDEKEVVQVESLDIEYVRRRHKKHDPIQFLSGTSSSQVPGEAVVMNVDAMMDAGWNLQGEAYKALVWGAVNSKIKAVIGSPPSKGLEAMREGWGTNVHDARYHKELEILAKQLFL